MNNTKAALKTAAPKQKKRKVVSLDRKKARSGWLFVLPFVIGFAIIYLPIVLDSIWLTFNSVRTVRQQGLQLTFIGLDNYKTALFEDANFVQTLTGGLRQLVIDIPAIVIFSLFIAVLLNQKMVGRAAFRAIFFIPVILATGLIAEIDAGNTVNQYMSGTSGIETGENIESSASQIISSADISMLFSNMSVGSGLVQTITDLVNDVYNIINRSGVQMLIFLAGLQSIDPAIYESCSIDGATSWETFWKITFPMISPMILVNTIYTVIDSFTSADNSVMNFISNYYNTTSMVVSSAMAWIYFVIVVAIVAIVSAILSAYIFYQRRD